MQAEYYANIASTFSILFTTIHRVLQCIAVLNSNLCYYAIDLRYRV